MAVASLAYQQLDEPVREEVDRLAATFSETSPRHSTFVALSTWLDDVRGNPDEPTCPQWHYTNIPYDPDGLLDTAMLEQIAAEQEGCDAVAMIRTAEYILSQSRSPDHYQARMLAIAIHTIADIHQPLHTTTRYDTNYPRGDHGGNCRPVHGAFTNNLHAYFDSGFERFPVCSPGDEGEIPEALLDFVDRELLPFSYCEFVPVTDPREWALESHRLAVATAYTLVDASYCPIPDVVEKSYPALKQRVQIAGMRLATFLNRTIGQRTGFWQRDSEKTTDHVH